MAFFAKRNIFVILAVGGALLAGNSFASDKKNVVASAATESGQVRRLPVSFGGTVRRIEEPRGVSAEDIRRSLKPGKLRLGSTAALVMDQREGVILFDKQGDWQTPIASVTKLMTAMVVLDSKLPLDQAIRVTPEDRDTLRGSHSRLRFGVTLTRYDMLHMALAASENRAAAALARAFPGGTRAFVEAMNNKAAELGMDKTHFDDSTGLNANNVSTAHDLARMVNASYGYPLIREFSTSARDTVTDTRTGRPIAFMNTNILIRKQRDDWSIGLSKTGYITDSGYCLVMQAEIADRPVVIVLLNSQGKQTKIGDANRIRQWLTDTERRLAALANA